MDAGEGSSRRLRVGIVGFGKLGQRLWETIRSGGPAGDAMEVAFVWNRTPERVTAAGVPRDLLLEDLERFAERRPDLVVEVSHPDVTRDYGARFLEVAHYYVGSPTAFADRDVDRTVRSAAEKSGKTVFVPVGALWGAMDIQKMDQLGILRGLEITMKKHPSSLKLTGPLAAVLEARMEEAMAGEVTVFEGSVRELCPLAPNNVNTMAVASLAAESLGFDGVRAKLVADGRLDAHVIDVHVQGPSSSGRSGDDSFRVSSVRHNPAAPGAVTGSLTFDSFVASLVWAARRAHLPSAASSSAILLC